MTLWGINDSGGEKRRVPSEFLFMNRKLPSLWLIQLIFTSNSSKTTFNQGQSLMPLHQLLTHGNRLVYVIYTQRLPSDQRYPYSWVLVIGPGHPPPPQCWPTTIISLDRETMCCCLISFPTIILMDNLAS